VKDEILKEINALVIQCPYITVEDGDGRYGYVIQSKSLFMMKISEMLDNKLK
jgi:hypothetical protein